MDFAHWATRQAAALGFQINRYRPEHAATDRYAQLIEFAPQTRAHRYVAQLERIRNAMRWSIDNFARTGLGQLRGELCQELPLATVDGELIEDIAADLQCLDAGAADARTRELNQVRIHLKEKLSGNGSVNEAALRVHLRALSQAAADAREAHRCTVDAIVSRLAIVAGAIIGMLLAVLLIIPPGMLAGLGYAGDLRERYFWLTMIFGALGSLISASIDHRTVEESGGEFLVYRQMLIVRALVGAVLALVVYLALTATMIAIKGIDMSPLNPSYLLIAFAMGFAERALAPQVWKIGHGASRELSTHSIR